MKTTLRERLLAKGWPPEEVDYTLAVLKSKEEKKSRLMQVIEHMIYWLAIIIAIIGNIVVAVVLIPFFLVLHAFYLYLIIIMLALGFGFLYDILLADLERLVGREMIRESIFIPALALISVGFMTYFANVLADTWNLSISHQPLFVGMVYALVFVSPWFVRKYLL
ncbi:MAG: hypothetical protein U9R34_01760 [Nanoarchaeota archaeon]|nr:hypothetical protein [Nanoarchaeota archaeon]